MTNNLDKEFKKLQKLNAQIDVWIDDEEYDKVYNAFQINDEAVYKDTSLRSLIIDLFREDVINTHENELDEKWRIALGYKENILPIIQADGKNFTIQDSNDNDELDQYWSHLFYAKLLRAKIQQRGSSDCYTRRLDDVAAYLERHLPQQNGQDEWVTKLTLMYLMELSATSPDWESLGFAERAWRVITDAKHSKKKASQKAPYDFYELWARYNIGVAYFHQAYYRKAVLEFNDIIWKVGQWGKKDTKPENEENLKFFEGHHGIALLYVPAILYRAEVQLKLQFAYHTLDTLNKYFWNNEKITSQKKIHAMLIEVQAYQQLGRLDKSWGILDGDKKSKVKEKQEGICKLVVDNVQLGQRTDCIIPERDKLNQRFPRLGERFIDILIADHLDWLTLKGKDEQQPAFKICYLAKGDKTVKQEDIASNYIEAVCKFVDGVSNKGKSYPSNLEKGFSTYFGVVKRHAYNRRGYFQQLAKYLAWLAKAADFNYSDPKFARGQEKEVKDAREKIAKIASALYTKYKEDILFEEDKIDESKNDCRHCQVKGIDLRRIEDEHYTWFTEDMLEFFNSENITKRNPQQLKKDKEKFVRRLIKREWKDRKDLRIHDLELRYEYYGKEELLKKLRTGKQSNFDYAQELCWRELGNQADLLNLLRCKRETNDNQEDDPSSIYLKDSDYIKIMKDWDDSFLHHLKSPSTHELPESRFYFLALQRWNSASPAKGFSVGGGYLLYHYDKYDKDKKCVDMGIAIDPGFDFMRNLFHMGFSLNDIDIVLISHAHLDHIRDFESIVMLLSELEKRGRREKRVHVVLSLGAYKRLKHIVEDPRFRYFVEPYIIDVDREIKDDYFETRIPGFRFESANIDNNETAASYKGQTPADGIERFRAVLPGKEFSKGLRVRVTITPTRAYHDDKTDSDSFGFMVELVENVRDESSGDSGHEVKLAFGYTGDTKWVYPNMPDPIEKGNSKDKREGRKIKDIAEQYYNCDVLLVHLGSLIDRDDDGELSFAQYNQCDTKTGNRYRCEELVREKDHPYLVGMLRLLSSLYKSLSKAENKGMPLVLVGEFGEELRGTIRTDFIQRLQGIYKNKLAFLPVDVGMNVYLHRKGDEQDKSGGNRCACRVWCVQCDHFVNIDDADFELYGTDHALYCVCKTCRKAIPLNVLQDRLRQLYEVGLELRTYDSK